MPVEVNQMIGLIGRPDFGFPSNLQLPFSKVCARKKSSDED
jgi:hypothetical protein